ncbi:hypothetical protein [Parendozoicomonas sp. Alg238-R29]|uniref:hypothetical protein n=1 Tax=Parendozoicomonas sp. Alg238-R29 TaxID=2993446 RepID=UPI00248E460A|nr:hypothetical protein [Parendozoicomonas sp. Alg238-R29]
MAHQSMSHNDGSSDRCNQENRTVDSRADAISAVALILLAVVIAVYWVSGQ